MAQHNVTELLTTDGNPVYAEVANRDSNGNQISTTYGALSANNNWTGSNYFPSVFIGSESSIDGQITSGDEDGDLGIRSVNGGIKFLFDTAPLKFWSSSSDTYNYNVERPQINADARLVLPAKSGTLATLDDLSPYMPKSGGNFTGSVTINGDVITTGTGMARAYAFCDSGQKDWVELRCGTNWSTSFGVSGTSGQVYNLSSLMNKSAGPSNALGNDLFFNYSDKQGSVGLSVATGEATIKSANFRNLTFAEINNDPTWFTASLPEASFPQNATTNIASERWVKDYVASQGGGGSGDATLAGNNTWTGTNKFTTQVNITLGTTGDSAIFTNGFVRGTQFKAMGTAIPLTATNYSNDGITNSVASVEYNYTFPKKSGTFALTSDVSGLLSSNNTWSGTNNFSNNVTFDGTVHSDLEFDSASGFTLGNANTGYFGSNLKLNGNTLTIPAYTGTLATQEWVQSHTAAQANLSMTDYNNEVQSKASLMSIQTIKETDNSDRMFATKPLFDTQKYLDENLVTEADEPLRTLTIGNKLYHLPVEKTETETQFSVPEVVNMGITSFSLPDSVDAKAQFVSLKPSNPNVLVGFPYYDSTHWVVPLVNLTGTSLTDFTLTAKYLI